MLGKVEICGVNTADLKVLSSDACRALLIRAKHGDTDAREQLIAGNLRLVLSVIQKFIGRERGRPVSGRLHRTDQGHR